MAKIPFSIDYKPQIEAGEYKVVTGDNRPVRIISWDKKVYGGRIDIVALVPAIATETECIQVYNPDGTLKSSDPVGKFKLTIITPEPELTEFEKAIKRGFLCAGLEDVPTGIIKDTAKELLSIAKRKLCNGCNANLEGYIKGRQDALKEMEGVYKHEGPYMPTYSPCYYGGECTNPFRDCTNCPRGSVTVGINTATGTSTAKTEEG